MENVLDVEKMKKPVGARRVHVAMKITAQVVTIVGSMPTRGKNAES
jgi:hypothetical protein